MARGQGGQQALDGPLRRSAQSWQRRKLAKRASKTIREAEKLRASAPGPDSQLIDELLADPTAQTLRQYGPDLESRARRLNWHISNPHHSEPAWIFKPSYFNLERTAKNYSQHTFDGLDVDIKRNGRDLLISLSEEGRKQAINEHQLLEQAIGALNNPDNTIHQRLAAVEAALEHRI